MAVKKWGFFLPDCQKFKIVPNIFFCLLRIFEKLNFSNCVKNTMQFYTVVNKKYSWNPIIQKEPKETIAPLKLLRYCFQKNSPLLWGIFLRFNINYLSVSINTGWVLITDNAMLSVPLGRWYFVLKFDTLPGLIKSGKTSSCSSTLMPLW